MSDKKADFMANLMRAKQTMDTLEGGNYKVDHTTVQSRMASNSAPLLESLPEGAVPQTNAARPMGTPTVDKINNSRLPDSVKRLMIDNPIPQMEMGSGGGPTFSMDDIKGMGPSNPQQQQPQQYAPQQYAQQQVNETVVTNSQGKMLITLTEAELDKKINDALMDFMAKTFAKNLTENTIKKTISTLIKEGKLKVKAKTAN
jgi:hypothetical protein|tara:strand:- start:14135 stop:14737 length:603 start_codon:yes stop_codon:yes gene_type:complete